MTSFNLDSYYKYRYFNAKADPKLQQDAAKLPTEIIGQILQYRFVDALNTMQTAETALKHKKPGEKLTPRELIEYNNALDEFHLVTGHSKTGLDDQGKMNILANALRLNHPRIYKTLTDSAFRVRSDGAKGDFGPALHLKDKQQFGLLSKAILTRRYGEAHKLLDKNLAVASADSTGLCPIDWASLTGHPKLVKRMLTMAGNQLLPPEITGLKAISEDEDNGISEKGRKKLAEIADKGELSSHDEKILRTIAQESKDPVTLNLIADRTSKNAMLAQADSQQALKKRLAQRGNAQYFDFNNIDLEDADVSNAHREIENVFRRGMAAHAAGKEMHPAMDYRQTTPMSSFGLLLSSTDENAHPRILSAAHALIQSGVDVNQNAAYEKNPIRLNRNPQIVDALLDAGADIHKLPCPEAEPILCSMFPAEQTEDTRLAQRLIRAGADVNAISETKITPLLNAAYGMWPNLAMLLLESGADSRLGETGNGDKAIHIAARYNHHRLIDAMLGKGSEIDPVNRQKKTPLHVATYMGNPEAVKTLLKHGANPEATDKNHNKPVDLAEDGLRDAISGFAVQSALQQGISTQGLHQVTAFEQILQLLRKPRKITGGEATTQSSAQE